MQDADTLLLEYALGTERSYVWAVTPASISGFELPPRARIEAAAQLHVRSRTQWEAPYYWAGFVLQGECK